jgi:hypothetical protein
MVQRVALPLTEVSISKVEAVGASTVLKSGSLNLQEILNSVL